MENARKRPRSQVWEHFSLDTPNKVSCLICDQTLSYSNNTSSMLRHLRSKHPNALANETPTTEHHSAPTGEELISDWGLTGSVAAMVTDNAANMVSAIQKLGLCHLPCFAHTINLIVKRAVEEHEVMAGICSRARRVVSYFRSSTNATEKLILAQERMGRQPLKLLQEVDTRWNSTHDMLQRLIDLREPVGAALASLSNDIMLPSRHRTSI
ncbi:E3 SUMO-protein ligase ZBED1 [Labeo rohita]|uniref:E3 SUMO-protein ligase ZBED1 n=1 Tax=Labeo rohita TaxID=84645 RepID=A0ABQ8L0D4_LABRO|nr:E3 SUMO-protein ligase ZBED1 [Labeo rohita]